MGAVYRACQRSTGRAVAIKIIAPHRRDSVEAQRRFRREGQLTLGLSHPHLVEVLAAGEEAGRAYLAMELLAGRDLARVAAEHGPLAVADACELIRQAALGVDFLAQRGFVHRDLKPSNLMLSGSPATVKVLDLGLVRDADETALSELTQSRQILGTYDYLAPEQARDSRTVDGRADIYSLGCTLYHMLTAEPPFPEGTVLQKLLQHQGDTAPDPTVKNPRVPAPLASLVRRMMAKDPRERPATPQQLLAELHTVAATLGFSPHTSEGLVWQAPPPGPAWWRRYAAPLSTVALLAGILGWLEWGRSGSRGLGSRTRLAPAVTETQPTVPDLDPLGTLPGGVAAGDLQGNEPTVAAAQVAGPVGSAPSASPLNPGSGGSPGRLLVGTERTIPGPGKDEPAAESATATDSPEEVLTPIDLAEAGLRPRPSGGSDSGEPERRELAGNRAGNARLSGTAAGPSFAGGERSPGRATSLGSAEEEAASEADLAEEEGFFLLGRDGNPDRRFDSLEAACAAVRLDGAVIELRFDGRRRETGFKIARRVTLRAGRRHTPVIELTPLVGPTSDVVRAITITTGALDVVGVEFVLQVGELSRPGQWALFSLDRPESLRLQGSTLTLENPHGRPVAAIEWQATDPDLMPDMPMPGSPPRAPLSVELVESLVRGEGDLLLVRRPDPLRIDIRQVVVALQGSLLQQRLAADVRVDANTQELRIDHATVALGGSLVRLECQTDVKKLPQVQVQASNCLFAAVGESPLVSFAASLAVQDLRSRFGWSGRYNFYDGVETFWSVFSREGAGRTETWDFSAWRQHWSESGDANPHVDAVTWASRGWRKTAWSELGRLQFALDKPSGTNLAPGGAGDSSDAGANLMLIPQPFGEATGGSEGSGRDRNRKAEPMPRF
ncbi:MAG: protein kinase domain-containing protein [Planctomycetaceae bacterium]